MDSDGESSSKTLPGFAKKHSKSNTNMTTTKVDELDGIKMIKKPLNQKQLKKYLENSVCINDSNLSNYVHNIEMRSVAEDELNSTNFFSNVSFDPNSKIERPNHQFNSMINYKAH